MADELSNAELNLLDWLRGHHESTAREIADCLGYWMLSVLHQMNIQWLIRVVQSPLDGARYYSAAHAGEE